MADGAKKPGVLFDLVTVVWGEAYTRLFLEVVVKNQLSPGNLPCFSRDEARYRIYTTPSDAETIRRNAAFRRVSRLLKTEILPIRDDVKAYPKHGVMTNCHKRAVRDAGARGAGLVFLSPDALLSDGSFARVRDLAHEGRRAVMIAGIRVVRDDFTPLLKDFDNNEALTLDSRSLMGLAMGRLHPITRACFWGSRPFAAHPSHLYFRHPSGGFIARCFHLHPLFVRPQNPDTNIEITIDGDFPAKACPLFSEVEIIRDSDEILCVEMSPAGLYEQGFNPWKARTLDVAVWARSNADLFHRAYARESLYFHDTPLGPDWSRVEEESDRVLRRIFQWLLFEPILFTSKSMALKLYGKIRLGILPRVLGDEATEVLVRKAKKIVRAAKDLRRKGEAIHP